MQQSDRQIWEKPKDRKTGWSIPTSVGLHLALVLLLLISLPEVHSPPPEQSIKVELVAPPKLEPKPQQAPEPVQKAQPKPQPQAFESAAAQTETEKTKETELPPTAPDKADNPTEAAAESEPQPEQEPLKSDAAASEQAPLPQEKPAQAKKTEQKETKPAAAKQANKLNKAKEIYSKDALSDPRVKQALGKLSPQNRVAQICSIEALEQVRHHRSGAVPDMLARDGGSVSSSSMGVSNGAFRSRGQWYAIDFKCTVNADTMAIGSFSYAVGQAIPRSEWQRRELPTD